MCRELGLRFDIGLASMYRVGSRVLPFLLAYCSFAAAVVTVVVYYLVFQGRHMLDRPLAAEDIFIFGEFSDQVSTRLPYT